MQDQKYKKLGFITLTTIGGRIRHVVASAITEVIDNNTDGARVLTRAETASSNCRESEADVMNLIDQVTRPEFQEWTERDHQMALEADENDGALEAQAEVQQSEEELAYNERRTHHYNERRKI